MPLVRSYVSIDPDKGAESVDGLIDMLFQAAREIIPAGMNSGEAALTPGSIEFFPHPTSERGMAADVLLEIEAFDTEDRRVNLQERAEHIKAAFSELFPGKTFAVCPKLVIAGWASDSNDQTFLGDMSMSAAVGRANAAINLMPFER